MIVLASASVSRAQVLRSAGISFDIVPSSVDEEPIKQRMLADRASLADVAEELATQKALDVSGRRPGDIVVGGDQVLDFQGELIGKMQSIADAARLLGRLRGKTHSLLGGLTLARGGKILWTHRSLCELTMRNFSDEFLELYLKTEADALLSSVGCYRLEGMGAQLFESIRGDYFAILGLALVPLLTALREQRAIAT
jgi:septum formation protein